MAPAALLTGAYFPNHFGSATSPARPGIGRLYLMSPTAM